MVTCRPIGAACAEGCFLPYSSPAGWPGAVEALVPPSSYAGLPMVVGRGRRSSQRGRPSRRVTSKDRRSEVEPPNKRIDPKEQLPDKLGSGRDAHHGAAPVDDTEHRSYARDDDERPCDEPEHGHTPRHQLGSIHQVTKQQSVADTDHEARPE